MRWSGSPGGVDASACTFHTACSSWVVPIMSLKLFNNVILCQQYPLPHPMGSAHALLMPHAHPMLQAHVAKITSAAEVAAVVDVLLEKWVADVLAWPCLLAMSRTCSMPCLPHQALLGWARRSALLW